METYTSCFCSSLWFRYIVHVTWITWTIPSSTSTISSATREVNASERKLYLLHCAIEFFTKIGKEYLYVSYREMMSAYRMMTFCRDRGFILLTCELLSQSDIYAFRYTSRVPELAHYLWNTRHQNKNEHLVILCLRHILL